MATKLGKVVTYDEGNSPMMSHELLTTSMTTKLGSIVTCNEGNSPIMSQNPSTMRSYGDM